MAGAEGGGDVGIILRALVGVLDQQADGRAGGFALEYAGKDFDFICFAPLGGVARSARLAPVQIALDVGLGELQSRRTTVDDGAQSESVALAESGDGEQFAVGVSRHGG